MCLNVTFDDHSKQKLSHSSQCYSSSFPYNRHNTIIRLRHAAEAGEGECIDYDTSENTITINCNSSFLDVVQTINDPDVIENLGNGEYLLKANLEVADGITFQMTSNQRRSDLSKDCWRKWDNSLWNNSDKWCKNNIMGYL